MKKTVIFIAVMLFLSAALCAVSAEGGTEVPEDAAVETEPPCTDAGVVRCNSNVWERCESGTWKACEDCAPDDTWCVGSDSMSDKTVRYYIPAIGIVIVLLVQGLLALIFYQFKHLTPSNGSAKTTPAKSTDRSDDTPATSDDPEKEPSAVEDEKIAAVTMALHIYMSGMDDPVALTETEDTSDGPWTAGYRLTQLSNYDNWKSRIKRMG